MSLVSGSPEGHHRSMQIRTDNTRSRDVFPAFSKPIIVTSISLALPTAISLQLVCANSACDCDCHDGGDWACARWCASVEDTGGLTKRSSAASRIPCETIPPWCRLRVLGAQCSVCGEGSTVNDRIPGCCRIQGVKNELGRKRKAGLLKKDGVNQKI